DLQHSVLVDGDFPATRESPTASVRRDGVIVGDHRVIDGQVGDVAADPGGRVVPVAGLCRGNRCHGDSREDAVDDSLVVDHDLDVDLARVVDADDQPFVVAGHDGD